MILRNPWLGLQSYRENDIIYGRDDDIRCLTQQVFGDTDTLLYGKTGIGKSSILNAGVIPIARRNGYVPIYIRLDHKVSSKMSYVKQIIASLEESEIEIRNRYQYKNGTPLLWELFHCNEFYKDGKRTQLIVIFDQFEEIFTLQPSASRKREFFSEIADFLNDVMPYELFSKDDDSSQENVELGKISTDASGLFSIDLAGLNLDVGGGSDEYVYDNDIHIVFTIREDFLSEFEYYTSAIPSLKQHRYALRPINEEQAAEIILKPRKGLVSQEVAMLIIQKITGRSDFKLDGIPEIEIDSAVLSLYMNRLYEKKEKDIITADLVENKGGSIILDFYMECVKDMPPFVVEYLEDNLINEEGRRENKSLNKLNKDIGAENVEKLIKCQLLRKFAYAGGYRVEFIHDILCPIIRERISRREQKRQQEEEKRRQAEAQKRMMLQEQKKREEIERKAQEERAELERKARQIKERNKRVVFSIIFFVFTIGAVFSMVWLDRFNKTERLYEEYYLEYEEINGWPVGVGEPLSEATRQMSPLYYRLSHRGNENGNRHTELEVMSSNENLPLSENRLKSLEWTEDFAEDADAEYFNYILSDIAKVRYSSIEGSELINKVEYLNGKGDILLLVNYFYIADNNADMLYYTIRGENLKIRENGLDRANVSWDSVGHIKSIMYYDAMRVPQSIEVDDAVMGYLWERPSEDTVIRYSLNDVGLPAQIKVNTIKSVMSEGSLEKSFSHSKKIGDKAAEEVACAQGYSRMVFHGDTIFFYLPGSIQADAMSVIEKDSKGNIKHTYTTENPFYIPTHIYYDYHRGLLIRMEMLSEDGKPFGHDETSVYKWEYKYDENDILIETSFTDINDVCVYLYKINKSCLGSDTIVETECLDLINGWPYYRQVDTIKSSSIITTYYDKDGNPKNHDVDVDGSNIFSVHKIVVIKLDGNTRISEYYILADGKILPMPRDNGDITRSYFRRIEEFDNQGILSSLRIEDEEGTIIKSMMYFIQNGKAIGSAVKGIDGNPVRCDKWEEEGFLYYKYYYTKNSEGNFSGLTAIDEWNHRSTIYHPVLKYLSLNKVNLKDKEISYMDDGELLEIKIMNEYTQMNLVSDTLKSNLEVPYIHVLSRKSSLYDDKNGVLDGDRIIELGKWKIGMPEGEFEREWHSALKNGKVNITVMRPMDTSYEKKKMRLECSPMEGKYIEYHIIDMSIEEKDFFNRFL